MAEDQKTLDKVCDRLFAELSEIKNSINRIHTKLDDTTKQTTVNNTAILYMRERITENSKKIDDEIKNVDLKIEKSKEEAIKIAQNGMTIKFYSALSIGALGLISSLISIIGVFMKSKLGF